MKPAAFRYFAPKSLDAVHALLGEYGETARILAGGQSLVPMLNMRVIQPDVLISINHCPELDVVETTSDCIVFKAAVRQAVAEESAVVQKSCPLLAAALPYVGASANRNRGTICGSLAHADPLAELTAVAVALDAEFVISNSARKTVVPASAFFISDLTTCIEPGEFLEAVRFPLFSSAYRCAFVEVGNRKHGFALAGIAAQLRIDENGRCQDVRLAGIGLGPKPMRLTACENTISGAAPSERVFKEAGRLASAASLASDDVHADAEYRRALAGVLVARALNQAVSSKERAQ